MSLAEFHLHELNSQIFRKGIASIVTKDFPELIYTSYDEVERSMNISHSREIAYRSVGMIEAAEADSRMTGFEYICSYDFTSITVHLLGNQKDRQEQVCILFDAFAEQLGGKLDDSYIGPPRSDIEKTLLMGRSCIAVLSYKFS